MWQCNPGAEVLRENELIISTDLWFLTDDAKWLAASFLLL